MVNAEKPWAAGADQVTVAALAGDNVRTPPAREHAGAAHPVTAKDTAAPEDSSGTVNSTRPEDCSGGGDQPASTRARSGFWAGRAVGRCVGFRVEDGRGAGFRAGLGAACDPCVEEGRGAGVRAGAAGGGGVDDAAAGVGRAGLDCPPDGGGEEGADAASGSARSSCAGADADPGGVPVAMGDAGRDGVDADPELVGSPDAAGLAVVGGRAGPRDAAKAIEPANAAAGSTSAAVTADRTRTGRLMTARPYTCASPVEPACTARFRAASP